MAGELIVKYRHPGALTASVQASVHARAGGTPAAEVGQGRGMQVVELSRGVSVEQGAAAYEKQPEVEWAQPNYLYQIAATPGDTMFGWQDGLENVGQTGGTTDADIDAPAAWDFETGDASVTVAVIDTGIDPTHPDLANNIWNNYGEIPGNSIDDDVNGYVDDTYGWDFYNDDKDPLDDHSHGTHVAGTIGAVGNDGRGVVGVMWDVSIMVLKGFNQYGNAGSSAQLVDAIDYASDNGADVINASWGDYGPYDNAIRSAIASSPALFVAAAGNNGLNTDTHPFYPAAYDLDNILAVAATDNKDALAGFSNYGTMTVDVAAPGQNILSTVPELAYTGQSLWDPGWSDIFYDSFPTAGGWTTTDYNLNPWKLSSAKPGSYSGVPAIANRDYSADEEAYLDLRHPVDLSRSASAGVLFDLDASLEPGYDFLVPIASTNGGATWSPIENVAYTGSTSGWVTEYLNLGEYLGEPQVSIAFVLVSDGSGSDDGVFIDDVEILTFGGYGLNSGTSMATPHVAGVAALLKAGDASLVATETKQAIVSTVDAKSSLSSKVASGGRLNAVRAVRRALGLVDSVPPTTTDDAPIGWQLSSVLLALTSSDSAASGEDTAGVDLTEYSVNAGAAQPYAGPIPITDEGTTTIEYASTDHAGNREATQTATVRIDTVPPTTSSDIDEGWQDGPVTVTLAATDMGYSGVEATYYTIDGGDATTYTAPFEISAEGTTGIEYWSVDIVGNAESPLSQMVRIDTVAPTTTSDARSVYYASAKITLSPSDATPGSGLDSTFYQIDGGTQTAGTVVNVTSLGSHTLDFWSVDEAGNMEGKTRVTFDVEAVSTERVSDNDRFTTAVQIAREGWADGGSDWSGVKHVVIASGEDRAAADPLAAAGLCGVYDAPLFLVSADRVPTQVKAAIKEIAADNPGSKITVHIVGGPVSVPDARYSEIASYVGASRLTKDRLLSTGGRFEMAAEIAREVKRVGGTTPKTVLIANGADATKFFDALALSPIAANNGYPILLVSKDAVPSATKSVMSEFSPTAVIVGGGPATVSDSVKRQLGATRWSGRDRYFTATTIADNAIAANYLDAVHVGVAAKLPDALTGGSMVGVKGGPLVITDGAKLTPVTGSWLTTHKATIGRCYIFGGERSVTPAVKSQISSRLQ